MMDDRSIDISLSQNSTVGHAWKATKNSIFILLTAILQLNIDFFSVECAKHGKMRNMPCISIPEEDINDFQTLYPFLYLPYYQKRPLDSQEMCMVKKLIKGKSIISGTFLKSSIVLPVPINYRSKKALICLSTSFPSCIFYVGDAMKYAIAIRGFVDRIRLNMFNDWNLLYTRRYLESRISAKCYECDSQATKHCSGCYVYYCSRECQTSSWKYSHSKECDNFSSLAVQSSFLIFNDKEKPQEERIKIMNESIDKIRKENIQKLVRYYIAKIFIIGCSIAFLGFLLNDKYKLLYIIFPCAVLALAKLKNDIKENETHQTTG